MKRNHRRMNLRADDADLMESVTRLTRRNRWRSRNRHEWDAELWDSYEDDEWEAGGPREPTAFDDDDYFLNR